MPEVQPTVRVQKSMQDNAVTVKGNFSWGFSEKKADKKKPEKGKKVEE